GSSVRHPSRNLSTKCTLSAVGTLVDADAESSSRWASFGRLAVNTVPSTANGTVSRSSPADLAPVVNTRSSGTSGTGIGGLLSVAPHHRVRRHLFERVRQEPVRWGTAYEPRVHHPPVPSRWYPLPCP